ncbi:class I SAM-dependent methyltransferase [Spartinivicinus poritis]|uniref:Methyltransferase domain-containing protein n=1 Tax=Spartinivicinus poritis TaxID=2994640 RepID=A0ABT5UJD3_9GAMM|nr:class I SAM-dependent methyltransferase [Spartinivicinus sp. A2-2]MDE1465523.1 methyltransferase domain-containing protein [Spartinivicinus sp. A2-2]
MSATQTDWNAKHYAKNSPVQKSISSVMLEDEDLNNLKVLDVGCGDGAITAQMKTDTNTVVGLDSSGDMIKFAHENYQECTFIEQDIREFESVSQFDLVTSFNCLHWISNVEQALANIYQATNKGGKFIGVIYPRCKDLWQASENLLAKYQSYFKNFSNPYQFHTLCSFSSLLRDTGFSKLKISHEVRSASFNNEKQFIDYIAGWMPHAKVTPPEFMTDWLAEYKQLTNQNGSSTIEMSYDVILFKCFKVC